MEIQLTYCELRKKDVINLVDGRRLGKIIDVVFDIRGRIEGFVVPGFKKWAVFKTTDNIFIRWCNIKKIGEDVILVELRPSYQSARPKGCGCDYHGKCSHHHHHDEDLCVDFYPNGESSNDDGTIYKQDGDDYYINPNMSS
ncbi:MAG TPA: YlmC/YmxH family sporulation protein [Clostridia bacterium]|jgi:YlmC/YmxH family sporulation protein